MDYSHSALSELAAAASEHHGPHSAQALRLRNNLAVVRAESGDVSGAVDDLGKLLEEATEHLGEDHDGTIAILSNFLTWSGKQDLDQRRQILERRMNQLGSENAKTYLARNNHAKAMGVDGDHAGALREFQKLLNDLIREFGPRNIRVFKVRANLATERAYVNGPIDGVAAFEEALDTEKAALGALHPHAIETAVNLAMWRAKAGSPERALNEVIELRKALRRRHPEPSPQRELNLLWVLPGLRAQTGDELGALAALEELLEALIQTQQPHSDGAIQVLADIASARGRQGDVVGAIDASQRLIDTLVAARLGRDTRATTARLELARWRSANGESARAIADVRALLNDLCDSLGPGATDVTATCRVLVELQEIVGDNEGAATDVSLSLERRRTSLGDCHEATVRTCMDLIIATALFNRRRAIEIAGLEITRLKAACVPTSGVELQVRALLLSMQADVGEVKKAIKGQQQLLRDISRLRGAQSGLAFMAKLELARMLGNDGRTRRAVGITETVVKELGRLQNGRGLSSIADQYLTIVRKQAAARQRGPSRWFRRGPQL